MGASCVSVAAAASPLSPEAALNRVMTSQSGMQRIKSTSPPQLKITTFAASQPAVYLFSKGTEDGFLVVSADDCTTPLLGYSDKGSLPDNFNELPEGMQYWLNSLAEQSTRNGNSFRLPSRSLREPIAPQTKTLWNQDAPYNNDCPTIGTRHCYTGCVATAMAQVLKYYDYPAQGTGTHSYTWNYTNANGTSGSQTLSFDYGATTFDWSNMTDTYNSSSTDTENEAVATLMSACGIAVDMSYGTSESGAVSFKMVPALTDNFGYDKGLQYHARDYYGLDEWETLVYDNLVNYGPVLYGGMSNDGGHQFVCDGYDGEGYFHFNWGWGGMSNGYFLLTALNPESQGIGGSTSGYNFQQDIVTNLTPVKTSENYYESMLWEGDFTVTTTSTTLGGKMNYTGTFYNYSSGTVVKPAIGLMLEPLAGGDPVFVKYSSFASLAPMRGIANGNFNVTLPTTLASGKYTVRPAFKTPSGGIQAMPAPINNVGSYIMTVSGSNVTFSADEPASVTAVDFQLESDVYANMPFKVTATLTDTSADKEYYGNLIVAFISNGTLSAMGEMSAVDLQPGETAQWEYVSELQQANTYSLMRTNSQYEMYLCVEGNSELTPIAGPIAVTIYPASTPQLTVPEFTIANGQHPNDITATATIGCDSGYFAGSLTLAVFPISGGQAIGQYSSEFFTVSAAASSKARKASPGSAEIEYHFNLTSGETNTDYFAVLYSGNTQISEPVQFRTAVTDGVEELGHPDEVVDTEYYSLTGVSLGHHPSESGISIARHHMADGSVRTERVVLR